MQDRRGFPSSELSSHFLSDVIVSVTGGALGGGGGGGGGGDETFLSPSFWVSAFQSFSSLDALHRIQRLGENVFAGLLLVACLQGVVALGQYRTNPSGQLIVPPGPTIGVAHPGETSNAESKEAQSANTTFAKVAVSALSSADGGNSTTMPTMTSPIITNATVTAETSTTLSEGNNRYTNILNAVNRWMVLLVPWIARQVSFLLTRNTHLFHLIFIVTISRIFDLPNYWAFQRQLQNAAVGTTEVPLPLPPTAANTTASSTDNAFEFNGHGAANDTAVDRNLGAPSARTISNILVLGDSLAVGLGSVDVFNSTKDNTLDYELIQNLDTSNRNDETGPVFPRTLAEALAEKQGTDVSWRSAGVDGGDTGHILEFCMQVLEEEVDQGRSPQVVVLLCGINDLKSYMSKPWPGGNPGPREFRKRLQRLIDSIHRLAPDCTVVLPAIPTQMFHRNSPMNIFPFNFVMDSLIGFWDSLKMGVADRVVDGDDSWAHTTLEPKSQVKAGRVYYIRTEPNEVLSWYGEPNPLQPMFPGASLDVTEEAEKRLIAGDGVHPNAKCYALWARSLADRLLTQTA